jgi:hypothetical protein
MSSFGIAEAGQNQVLVESESEEIHTQHTSN